MKIFYVIPLRAVHPEDSLPLFVRRKLHRGIWHNPNHGSAISTP